MPATAFTIGLLLPYGVQPGADVGLDLDLARPSEHVVLVLGPHAGTFVRPENHVSFITGAAFGVGLEQKNAPIRHTLGIGVDFLLQSQVTSWAVDLATGTRTATRELRHFVLPTGATPSRTCPLRGLAGRSTWPWGTPSPRSR